MVGGTNTPCWSANPVLSAFPKEVRREGRYMTPRRRKLADNLSGDTTLHRFWDRLAHQMQTGRSDIEHR